MQNILRPDWHVRSAFFQARATSPLIAKHSLQFVLCIEGFRAQVRGFAGFSQRGGGSEAALSAGARGVAAAPLSTSGHAAPRRRCHRPEGAAAAAQPLIDSDSAAEWRSARTGTQRAELCGSGRGGVSAKPSTAANVSSSAATAGRRSERLPNRRLDTPTPWRRVDCHHHTHRRKVSTSHSWAAP